MPLPGVSADTGVEPQLPQPGHSAPHGHRVALRALRLGGAARRTAEEAEQVAQQAERQLVPLSGLHQPADGARVSQSARQSRQHGSVRARVSLGSTGQSEHGSVLRRRSLHGSSYCSWGHQTSSGAKPSLLNRQW